jgi:hypothetical protein
MAKPTLDAQVSALGKILNQFNFSVSDRKALAEAEQTLKALVAVREALVEAASSNGSGGNDLSDHVSEEMVKLLGLATAE